MNLVIAFLAVCVILGLWAPTRSKKLGWAIPILASGLMAYFIITHFNHL